MNNIKIKVNGVAISLENSPVINDTNLEDMSALLSKESNNIEKMIKATALLSDIKTVESFGYVSTEGVGQSIKGAMLKLWDRVKEFFGKIAQWCVKILLFISKTIFKSIKSIRNRYVAENQEKILTDKVYKLCTEHSKGCNLIYALVGTNNDNVVTTALNYVSYVVSLVRSGQTYNENKIADKRDHIERRINDIVTDNYHSDYVCDYIVAGFKPENNDLTQIIESLSDVTETFKTVSHSIVRTTDPNTFVLRSDTHEQMTVEPFLAKEMSKVMTISSQSCSMISDAVNLVTESLMCFKKIISDIEKQNVK